MQRILSKLDFFINLFNNVLHNKNVTVFVGQDGISLAAIKKHQTIEEIYLPYESVDIHKQYQDFLLKYKDFYVSFLLDTKTSKINRHILPIVSSILKFNPVDKFIRENYAPEDLVAYNIYNITNRESEIWNTLIANCKYEAPLSEFIEYAIKFHKYSGIYLLALESGSLIHKILSLTKNEQYQNHFQIFVTILRSSSLKIIIKRKNNILHDLTFPVKLDRSDEFLKGTIEQLISDQIIDCKEYITRHSSEICVVLLINNNLKAIIDADNNFCKPHKVITLTPDNLKLQIPKNEGYFQESVIINLTTKSTDYLAYNAQLKQYNKCNFINNLLFKPFIIVILCLLTKLTMLQYNIITQKYEVEDINSEYFLAAKNYREIITKYPKSYDLNNLVDLYTIKQLLAQKIIMPDDFVNNFFNLQSKTLRVRNFLLQTNSLNHSNISNNHVSIIIEATYIVTTRSEEELENMVGQDLKKLKSFFPNYLITFELETTEGYKVSGTFIAPIKFTLTKII